MQIKIVSQNLNLNKAQEDMIRQKVEKLATFADRVSDESSEIKVEISYEKTKKPEDAYRCVLTLFVPQDTLRAKSRDESLRNVVDEVIEKVKGQIEHYKSKINRMDKRK